MKNQYQQNEDIEQSGVQINSFPNSRDSLEAVTFERESSFQSAKSA